jgi:hypothetical protein
MCTKKGTITTWIKKPLTVNFFKQARGKEPVREWLKGLQKADKNCSFTRHHKKNTGNTKRRYGSCQTADVKTVRIL